MRFIRGRADHLKDEETGDPTDEWFDAITDFDMRKTAHSLRETTLRDCLLIEEVRFALDSPLEGDGFEPSVPRREGGLRTRPSIRAHSGSAPVQAAAGRMGGDDRRMA